MRRDAPCCTCLRRVPPVPGQYSCCVAHVDPKGDPCLDGQHECKPGDTCTEWSINLMSARGGSPETATQADRDDWQARNLDALEL